MENPDTWNYTQKLIDIALRCPAATNANMVHVALAGSGLLVFNRVNEAPAVIDQALAQYFIDYEAGTVGFSDVMYIYNALQDAGLLTETN